MMDPNLERLEKQVDGLLASWGAMIRTQTEHEIKLLHAGEQRQELRGSLRDAIEDLREEIQQVDKDCKEFREEYRANHKADVERMSTSKTGSRMLAIGVISAIITAAGVILALIVFLAGLIGG